LLGLERFAGDGACRYSARNSTDVILYGVEAEAFESGAARYPVVKRFLAAHFSVSSVLGFGRTSWLDAEAPPIDFLRARHSSAEGAVAATLSTRAVVREMLRARTEIVAISPGAFLTAADLAMFCGHNPARLIGAIRNAGSVAEMTPLLPLAACLVLDALAQPSDIDDCRQIGTEVIAAIAEACIRLAGAQVMAAGIDPPAAPYCWVMFGASARGELLSPAPATIAAVYDDSDGAFQPADSLYFAAVAGETLGWFHALGLSGPGLFWPEGSQPCMPLSEWSRLFRETIRNPLEHDLYARREFFDALPLSGDASILQKLHDEIALELRDHEMAIPLLANDTLGHLPPLTFFHGLVLELDGAQRDTFDIAGVAIIPITDAARVFAIASRRLAPAGTLERLEAAQRDFPSDEAIFREAADAFRIALYYQALAGGSQVNAGKLGRLDQLLLKTAFSSIHRLLEFTSSTFVSVA
jgi:CBS domain-containing protein